MKIGYQGISGCYSEEVIIKLIGDNYKTEALSDFESVFLKVSNGDIEYAIIPIENSLGGSLHINYDLLIKYDLKIIAEYNFPINHCLLCYPDNNLEDIKYVTSHPQALLQCTEYIENNKLIQQDFFDTAGAAKFIKDNCKKNIAAIASKRSAEIYGLKILDENIQNRSSNYTRFLLLSKGIKTIVNNYIPNKTSIAFSLNNDPGALATALSIFSNNNINLTKIESRPNNTNNKPNNTNNTAPYQYLFYLDFIGNQHQSNCREALTKLKNESIFFDILGSYPSINENKETEKKLKIGIVGFGRFGKFLSKELSNEHWIWAHSRTDYTDIASDYGACFVKEFNDFIELNLDCLIISTSISSFDSVVNKFPKKFLDNKLLVDVLSVKSFPKNIMLNIDSECDILCTHPMFGPDSANNGWTNLPFVYEKVRITDEKRCDKLIKFFKNMDCKILEMTAEEHDEYSANSQFITHLTGRLLNELNIQTTPINTQGFDYLLNIMDNTCNDSMDLFQGLYSNNPKSIEILNMFEEAIIKIKNILQGSNNNTNFKIISESGTSKLQRKMVLLKSENKEILDFSIGEPDFSPFKNMKNVVSDIVNKEKIGYTCVEGTYDLRNEITKYLDNYKSTSYSVENILCCNGAKQAIYQTLLYLCDHNTEVIIPTPFWTSYPKMVELVGAKPVFIETDIEKNFSIDVNRLEEKITPKTKVLILCNPSNPSGTIYTLETLEKIAVIVQKYGIFVISDEIYEMIDFYKSHFSFAKIKDMKKFTFTINGFSKGFAMSGFRLGYVAGPAEHIKNMIALQSQITSCPSYVSQKCGQEALSYVDEYYENIDRIKNVGEYLYNSLIKIPNIKCAMPMGGITIFPDISYYLNFMSCTVEDFCEKLLDHYHIAISPGTIFGNPMCIRISFGINMAKAEEFIKRFNLFLNNGDNAVEHQIV